MSNDVQGLKIADMSIAPENVGAVSLGQVFFQWTSIDTLSQNTYNTAWGIGEKAAIIIADELGIKGV